MSKLHLTHILVKRLERFTQVRFAPGRYPFSNILDNIRIESPCVLSSGCSFDSKFHVGAFTSITNDHLVRAPLGLRNVSIGRYCSIAPGVWTSPMEHPISALSTSLIFGGGLHRFQGLHDPALCGSQYPVTIGNDVWIGANVGILGGISIGDGAIIAGGAVVTHDVPPYAIVGGIPAKIIRMRFPAPIIQALLTIQWWQYAPQTLATLNLSFRTPEPLLKAADTGILEQLPVYTGSCVTETILAQYTSWRRFIPLPFAPTQAWVQPN